MKPSNRVVCLANVVLSLAAFTFTGCGSGGLVTVEGKALVDNLPVAHGNVSFKPDAQKGNTATVEPRGDISQGKYQVFTNGKPGAPAGWYKVVVIAEPPVDPNNPYAPRKSHVNGKYAAPATTDLSVEVVAKPPDGAYDLKMTK